MSCCPLYVVGLDTVFMYVEATEQKVIGGQSTAPAQTGTTLHTCITRPQMNRLEREVEGEVLCGAGGRTVTVWW